MPKLLANLATALAVAASVGCGPEPSNGAQLGGNQAVPPGGGATSSGSVRACELVDLNDATSVLGSGTEHPGGDTELL